ncbi:MAG: tRNA (adenosine(37)-N6)-threonylcarbamoyltransferase complex transferase subunit TsaD [Candidatus Neomarinimicrobiota bacterium]
MTVLGIETSCDETAGSVCRDGTILSSVISSQDIHAHYGGIVPEIASREHEKRLTSVVEEAMQLASLVKGDLDAVAVTRGPGLMGSLLTGVSFARGFAQGLGIPCLGINHIEAHIFANFIAYPELKYPFLCLLASGGHTQIWRVSDLGDYELLGETRDDAAGEAFDKGARILGLGFPGGPALEEASRGGNEEEVAFPRAFLQSQAIEYSFSGLKTSLINYVKGRGGKMTEKQLAHVAASYQKAIVDVLLFKLRQAVDLTGVKTTVIAGGVAANNRLRREAERVFADCTAYYPPRSLCTDNAAMVAFLGEKYFLQGARVKTDLSVVPNLSLTH